MKYDKNIIPVSFNLKAALEHLDSISSLDSLTLFVVDNTGKLLGTLTDGDIRRSLIKGVQLTDSVELSMNKEFRYIKEKKVDLGQIRELKRESIGLVPVIDDQARIRMIVDLNRQKGFLPMNGVIMAGGEGRRLHPLTLHTPKPLLKIGEKPILEYNLELLRNYGINCVTISVRYKSDMIKDYFGDGKSKGLFIDYVSEDDALGTIGAISLIPDFKHEYFLVMNSDVLTNIDLEDFYEQVVSAGALIGVATIPYKVSLPYGVVETKDGFVVNLKEKPTYTYYSNAGIYIINRSLKEKIPHGAFFNATDLIDICLKEKTKVLNYPILSYWLDIGKHEDYAKAQEDIKHLRF